MDEGYEIICTKCRAPVSSDADVCPRCGQRLFGPTDVGSPAPQVGWAQQWRPPSAVAPAAAMIAAPPSVARIPATAAATYGGFWRRVVANVIDSLVLLVPTILLRETFGQAAPLVSLVVDWLYFALLESSAGQATLGKAALGLAVTDTRGERISFGRATGRYFAKFLSALILGVGFLMVAWTRRKQGLHDFIAVTLVVRR